MKRHIALIRKDSKYWTVFLLMGIVFILTGCYSLVYPFARGASIARIMGLLSLLTGFVKIKFTISKRQVLAHWQRHIAFGIIDILTGIFLISYQGISILILPFLLSFWILSGGIAVIEEATDINIFHTSNGDWLLIGAVLSIAAFFIAAYLPILGSLAAMLAAAIFLIIVGVVYILLSLRLKGIKKEFKDVSMNLMN